MDQVQHPCECHVCIQGTGDGSTSSLSSTCLPTSRLHTGGHQFFSEKTAAHPALHLYPHIHGHLPLHNLSHLPRPLLPTLYSTPPLTHSKVRHAHTCTGNSQLVGTCVIFPATRGVTCIKNHNLKKRHRCKISLPTGHVPFHITDYYLSSNDMMPLYIFLLLFQSPNH